MCESKGIGEVMDVVDVPVKMKREREVLEVADTRKRKKRDGDLVEMSPKVARVRTHSGVLLVAPANLESPASELSSQGNTVSCKPAEDSVKIATSYSEFRESRETILSSKFKVELHKLESTPRPQHAKSCRRRLTEAKMPSEAELDEFFAAAEKDLHKHFAEKYNFDFAKEEPLEGRYEWIRQ